MPTKTELQKENKMLKELVKPSIEIHDSTFNGSASKDTCEAVSKIADALKEAAIALKGFTGETMLHFGDKHYHDQD